MTNKHARSSRLGLLSISILATMISSASYAAEYLVKYRNHTTFMQLSAWDVGPSVMQIMDQNPLARLVKIKVPDNQRAAVLAQLYSQKGIEYIVPNFKLRAYQEVNDPGTFVLRDQWAIKKVNAEKAWALAGNKGSKKIIVAVIDTGVDYKHKNLAPNMIAGYDFKDNDADPMDKTSFQNPGHGTHCSGVIGATGLIDNGTIGLSPEVSIMPLRFLGEDGSGDLNDAIKAIDYAVEKGAHVISASWGATVPRSQAAPLLEAIKRADSRGVIFVAAAANDGKNNDKTEVYPANNGFPNSITVAASGASDAKPSWSNYGRSTVHVASPGENIMSTVPGDKYSDMSGTSMATPLVSGLVALMKAQNPSITGEEARAILQATGAQVSIQTACNCRVDALQAIDLIKNKRPVIVPVALTIPVGSQFNIHVFNGVGQYQYVSSDTSILEVTADGTAKGIKEGVARIQAKDAGGNVVTSLDYIIGKASSSQPEDPNQPDPGQPGDPGECPIGDPQLCEIICKIKPELPFCKN